MVLYLINTGFPGRKGGENEEEEDVEKYSKTER
jgi:hypothetical protein